MDHGCRDTYVGSEEGVAVLQGAGAIRGVYESTKSVDQACGREKKDLMR